MRTILVAFIVFGLYSAAHATLAAPTRNLFKGELVAPDAILKIKLAVTVDKSLPQPEQTVHTAILVMGQDKKTGDEYIQFSIIFPKTKWDRAAEALDAVQDYMSSSGPFTLTLACKQFKFDEADYDFQCAYTSTLKQDEMTLRLHAK